MGNGTLVYADRLWSELVSHYSLVMFEMQEPSRANSCHFGLFEP